MGYQQNEPVTGTGEFSIRGGIVDIFTPILKILCALISLETLLKQSKSLILRHNVQLLENNEAIVLPLKSSENIAAVSILDYLSPDTIWLIDEPEDIMKQAKEYERKITEGFEEARERDEDALEPEKFISPMKRRHH